MRWSQIVISCGFFFYFRLLDHCVVRCHQRRPEISRESEREGLWYHKLHIITVVSTYSHSSCFDLIHLFFIYLCFCMAEFVNPLSPRGHPYLQQFDSRLQPNVYNWISSDNPVLGYNLTLSVALTVKFQPRPRALLDMILED